MILEGKKINFLGDSITQGVGVSTPENYFPEVMKRSCKLAEARNYGISGTRIARQNEDGAGSSAYCDRYMKMDADADVVVVFGGTNDYGHGNAAIGTFEDRTETTYYGACHVLMNGLLNRFPDATILFLTPLHRVNDSAPSQFNQKPLSLYCDIIKETAAYYAIPVLDLYEISGIQPDVEIIRNKYCPDGLHPNAAGHQIIANRIAGILGTL